MKKLIPLVIMMLLFAACDADVSTTPSPVTTPGSTSSGYPVPQVVVTQPGYPVADVEEFVVPSPTIDPTLGQVKGTFRLQKVPDMPFVLYLAPTVKDSKGQEIVVNFDRSISIAAEPDQQGNFTFINVPAGRYGLVYDAIATSFLMTVPGKQETMLITVNGNETIDLGQLNYEAPPN